MPTATRTVEEETAVLMLRVACPLIWHDRAEGWPKLIDGATCFFVRFETGVIGITAAHVVRAYGKAFAANPNVICQLGASPAFDLAGATISTDDVQDLATFAVPDALPAQIGKIALDCRGSWPPLEPKNGRAVSLCGYPESHRTLRDVGFLVSKTWGAWTIIEHVTPDEVLITFDPAKSEVPTWAPGLPLVGSNLSGCSGGPVLLHVIRNGLYRWFPVALIGKGPKGEGKQGAAAEFDMIRLQRLHVIQPDGTILQREKDVGGWLPR